MAFQPNLKTIMASVAFAALTTFGAHAADIVDVMEPADAMVIDAPQLAGTVTDRLYIAARLGAGSFDPIKFNLDTAPIVPVAVQSKYGNAFTGSVALGYNFDMNRFGVRVEAEAGMATATVKNHTVVDQALIGAPTSFDKPSAYGDAGVTYGLANAAVDVKLGAFSPYVTAGVGMATVDLNNHGIVLMASTLGLGPGLITALDSKKNGLAWQAGAGIGYMISDKVTLDFGYRHFRVEDIEIVTTDNTKSKTDFVQNVASLGVRFGF